MKKLILSTAWLLLVSSFTNAQVRNISDFGSPVTKQVAIEWLENRKNQVNDQLVYFFDKNTITKIFTQAVDGVYIFNALDDNNREALIIKPARASGDMIHNTIGYMGGTSWKLNFNDLTIPDETAARMVEKFQSTHQQNFSAHVYGRKSFDQLMTQPGAEGICIMKGLDNKGEEHLILEAVDRNGKQLEHAMLFNHGSGIFFILYLQEKLGLAGK